ncbi:hypothetical protein [Oscillatoria salina]|nr:hypothetical protein [Oscillatoria salina]MBZ8178590.1 hypothetical protein [Oscillatoria salina IIICB1]NET87339.1 hypothetical protein [Kamptonema sp. SIO1D9]
MPPLSVGIWLGIARSPVFPFLKRYNQTIVENSDNEDFVKEFSGDR